MLLLLFFSIIFFTCCEEYEDGEVLYFSEIGLKGKMPEFVVEMADSGFVYRTFIIAQISNDNQAQTIPLTVSLTSPSSLTYSETIDFPASIEKISSYIDRNGNESVDLTRCDEWFYVKCIYRDNSVPVEGGEWKITFDTPDKSGLLGLGFAINKFIIVSNEPER